jgi:hypothetical protein
MACCNVGKSPDGRWLMNGNINFQLLKDSKAFGKDILFSI